MCRCGCWRVRRTSWPAEASSQAASTMRRSAPSYVGETCTINACKGVHTSDAEIWVDECHTQVFNAVHWPMWCQRMHNQRFHNITLSANTTQSTLCSSSV